MIRKIEWQQSPVTVDVAENSSALWNGEICPLCLIRYQSCRSIKSLYSVTPFNLWLGIFRILVRDWMTSIFMQTLQRLRTPIVRLTFQSGCLYWWWGPLQRKTPLRSRNHYLLAPLQHQIAFFECPQTTLASIHPWHCQWRSKLPHQLTFVAWVATKSALIFHYLWRCSHWNLSNFLHMQWG